jgi:hypothetical protein
MNKKLYSRILIVILSLSAFTCTEENDIKKYSTDSLPGRIVKLGKKLKNPYKVSVMKQALENIRKLESGRKEFTLDQHLLSELDIRTTTLYIRFLPVDYDEYDILASDTTIELFDHPLDYEMLEEGDFYHDPTIPPGQPTWQYTAFLATQSYSNNIDHEIMEELYVPQDDSDILLPDGEIQPKWVPIVDALEVEALKITGNELEPVSPHAREQGSSWRPSGTIKLYDDYLRKDMPVVGAKVRARRWFTFHRGYTNSGGYFSVDGTFKRPANYSIKWERADWDIRSGTFGQAYGVLQRS